MSRNGLVLFFMVGLTCCRAEKLRSASDDLSPTDAGLDDRLSGCSCPHGFHCENSACVLNGENGGVQVTLRWKAPQDLDLHVVEPLPNGESCEIYYLDRGQPSSCGAKGLLDLDSNASCNIDGIDTENVIYPPDKPAPSGTYRVLVDYFEHCNGGDAVPYEVTVRVGSEMTRYTGKFQPTNADEGGQGSGSLVATFVVP